MEVTVRVRVIVTIASYGRLVDDDRVYLETVFLEIKRDSVCRRRRCMALLAGRNGRSYRARWTTDGQGVVWLRLSRSLRRVVRVVRPGV